MPVMRHLNVGGTTYDTVGEASVTQVLSSGTKIATVSIDGTSTDLYAPAGGSSVDPATAAPSMDGTAAVGSSVKYAREDHVHPHDTSKLGGVTLSTSADTYVVPVTGGTANLYVGDGLNVSDSNNKITLKAKTGTTSGTVATGDHTHSGYQATLVSGTNIKTVNSESLLGSGNIAVQPTLVSGTNIKTINSTSLLGSGNIAIAGLPSVSASDNGKVLQVSNGAWAAATPSGGGIGYATETVTLTAASWSPGLVGYSNIATSTICTDPYQDVIVAPKANAQADSSTNAWAQYGVRCVSVGVGFLEFAADRLPTSDIYVNVMAFDY